jgi:hypothetical protein
MAKKFSKTVRKPLSPKPVVKQVDTAYLVREDLDEQEERLRKAAAAGAAALKTPAPTAPAEQPPAPATVPSKPLAPLAALWPDSVPSKGESRPAQAPAPQIQKAPVTAIAPKPAPATAAPLPQPPAQSAPPKSPEKAAAPKTRSVSFALHKPDAKRVSLCGEFNGWSPTATPMKRHDDGHWETTVALAPGRYQYKFIVDEEWIADPAAQKNVPNEHGSLNSVVEVRA